MNKTLLKGVCFALLTAIISGIALFYSKLTIVRVPPILFTASRNTYVALAFLLLFLLGVKININELKKAKKKTLILLILVGIIGGAVPFYLFFTGLQYTGAMTANLIHKTLFIWVSILAMIFLGEKFNFMYFVSYLLIVAGSFYILPVRFSLAFGKGEFMIFAATMLWAIENIIAKRVLREISSNTVALARMGIGSIVLLAFFFGKGNKMSPVLFDFDHLTTLIIGGSLLFFYVFFWYRALKYAPASIVTLILTFATIAQSLLIRVYTGVHFAKNSIYSMLLVGIGIALIFAFAIWQLFHSRAKPVGHG